MDSLVTEENNEEHQVRFPSSKRFRGTIDFLLILTKCHLNEEFTFDCLRAVITDKARVVDTREEGSAL